MTDDRFQALLGGLLDGELSPAEGDELAAAVGADPARRRELRRSLVLWELWAQQRTPERSAAAFLAGWQTRLRAERQGESFLASLRKRLAGDSAAESPAARSGAWWRVLGRPAGLAWAASLAIAVCATFLWLLAPHRAAAMTILRGEAVCPACTLHDGHAHQPALRVQTDGGTQLYYLEGPPRLAEMQGYFCSGPNPLAVEGTAHPDGARVRFNCTQIDVPPPSPKPAADQRVLFPL